MEVIHCTDVAANPLTGFDSTGAGSLIDGCISISARIGHRNWPADDREIEL